ncbi:MAG: lactate racemase domain-containing protein [bacterium]|nr:lactate racemase domain-containing protein [bacterium]
MLSHSTSEGQICLPFGYDTTWRIHSDQRIASFLDSACESDCNLDLAIPDALSGPIQFPSLDQAIVPGDQVVFPVDPSLPALLEVVPRVLEWFAARGTSPENMCVVVADNQSQAADRLSAAMADRKLGGVRVELHDPDDQNHVAYVAANSDAEPIYMNRTLVDADVAIPVTCCRPATALDYLGAYGIYPLLSDRSTRGAFYRLSKLDDPNAHSRLTSWADQAARWAGFMVEIQVVPAGKDRVAAVLSGLTEPLEEASRELMSKIWSTRTPPADLTIALLDGEAYQNWLGIARALHSANRCTHHRGAIVLCTQARESLGRSLGRLRNSQSTSSGLAEKISRDVTDDAIAASLVHQTTMDKHVYLVSNMQSPTIESLGMGVIEREQELQHLVDQFDSTLILGSVQHRLIELC